jgi:hypothetical protein
MGESALVDLQSRRFGHDRGRVTVTVFRGRGVARRGGDTVILWPR